MNKVFISYVSENIEIVDRLYQELKSHGIQVWLDRNDIDPGSRWEQAIRKAIRQGAFFIACFSEQYNNRHKTYMNEELTLAINELRQRPTDQIWFIPIKLNECKIPDRNIGGGETLQDLQYVNLYEDWNSGIQRIVKAVQPASSETATSTNTSEQPINQNAEAYYNSGWAYTKGGKYTLAIENFTKAIDLNPNYVEAYYNRGAAYNAKDEFDHAIEDYNTALMLKPKVAEVYYNRGTVYDKKGEPDRAIVDFNTAIKLKSDFALAYNSRGGSYGKKGEHNRSIADFTKAIDLNPNYTEAYYNRGLAYSNTGQLARAIADYNAVIALNPSYAIVYYNRGVVRLHLGEWEKARADLMDAKSMGVDIIAEFHYFYASVPYFERRNGVKLPADITAMLTPQ